MILLFYYAVYCINIKGQCHALFYPRFFMILIYMWNPYSNEKLFFKYDIHFREILQKQKWKISAVSVTPTLWSQHLFITFKFKLKLYWPTIPEIHGFWDISQWSLLIFIVCFQNVSDSRRRTLKCRRHPWVDNPESESAFV